MKLNAPDFIDSKYLIIDEKGWRATDDAPEEFKKKLSEYLESLNTLTVDE